jgi:amino acid transporter
MIFLSTVVSAINSAWCAPHCVLVLGIIIYRQFIRRPNLNGYRVDLTLTTVITLSLALSFLTPFASNQLFYYLALPTTWFFYLQKYLYLKQRVK